MNSHKLRIHRLSGDVFGHCSVCGGYDAHGHFDKDLIELPLLGARGLVCAGCKRFVEWAEIQLRAWCCLMDEGLFGKMGKLSMRPDGAYWNAPARKGEG